jgi:hypothetical protein
LDLLYDQSESTFHSRCAEEFLRTSEEIVIQQQRKQEFQFSLLEEKIRNFMAQQEIQLRQ